MCTLKNNEIIKSETSAINQTTLTVIAIEPVIFSNKLPISIIIKKSKVTANLNLAKHRWLR